MLASCQGAGWQRRNHARPCRSHARCSQLYRNKQWQENLPDTPIGAGVQLKRKSVLHLTTDQAAPHYRRWSQVLILRPFEPKCAWCYVLRLGLARFGLAAQYCS